MTAVYVFFALVMLGILVLVHEAGHFFASRITGIPVREFSVGFGPKLLQWKSKKYDTVFRLRLILCGGYCMYYGEDDPTYDNIDPRSLRRQNVWKRLFAIIMGPLMNILLAYVVCLVYLLCVGQISFGDIDQSLPCIITEVTSDSPAEKAGLQAYDSIVSVNGHSALGTDENGNYKLSVLIDEYKNSEQGLTLTVQRNNEEFILQVCPEWNEAYQKLMLGITYGPQLQILSVDSAGSLIIYSGRYMLETGSAIIKGLASVFSSWQSFTQNSSGPIGIVSQVAKTTEEYGITAYIELLIMISVNLGIFNMLPIPGLDGSRIVFLLIEAVGKKAVSQKTEAIIHLCGYLILFALIILCTCQDIIRLF